MSHGAGPPSECSVGSHDIRSSSAFPRPHQFQSTSIARMCGPSPTKQRLSLRRSKWTSDPPPSGADAPDSMRAGRHLRSQPSLQRPRLKNGPGSSRTRSHPDRCLRSRLSMSSAHAGGVAAATLPAVDRTATIRCAFHGGGQSASLRSSRRSSGASPSSSQPSSAGMKGSAMSSYARSSRLSQLATADCGVSDPHLAKTRCPFARVRDQRIAGVYPRGAARPDSTAEPMSLATRRDSRVGGKGALMLADRRHRRAREVPGACPPGAQSRIA